MKTAHPECRQLRLLQPLCLSFCRSSTCLPPTTPIGVATHRVRGEDERADDKGLPALCEVTGEPRVRLGAALVRYPAGDHGLSARRRLVDLGDSEIAVDRQSERARDRRRGHVQPVGCRAPACEGDPLLDAEAVLLVDHSDGQLGQLDTFLDERVGAHRHGRRSPRELEARCAPVASRERARQQEAANAERGADRLDGQEVLLCERLRRRHQRSLAPLLHRSSEGVERDDRLAGADVPL